jgi:hypothetical protein
MIVAVSLADGHIETTIAQQRGVSVSVVLIF